MRRSRLHSGLVRQPFVVDASSLKGVDC